MPTCHTSIVLVLYCAGIVIIMNARVLNITLSAFLVCAVLGALGVLGYQIANPGIKEYFTEFYLLGLEGRAADYPEQMVAGREYGVTIGIVNREHEPVQYSVEITINGAKYDELEPITLRHDEKWERIVYLRPEITGEKQKVEFILYKQGHSGAYQTLHLWVDVIEDIFS